MRICRICGSKNSKLQYIKNGYRYYQCLDCLILFLCPIPSQKIFEKYYRNEFEYTAGLTEEKRIRSRSNNIIRNLIHLNPQGKTLLDIGSGYGYFLDEAKKLNLEVTGIEPSRKLHSISINQLIDTNIVFSSFEQYFKKKKKEKFDFITLIHVIEHVPDPLQFIRQASQLMNRNGILYIETPNFDSWLAKTEKENYTFLTPPDHVWLFSPRSFKKMLKNFSNIQIEQLSTYSHPEHFMGILKRKLKISNYVKRHPEFISGSDSNQIPKQVRNDKKLSDLKYRLFDRFLAPLFTPLLNVGIYGSILELYIKKK